MSAPFPLVTLQPVSDLRNAWVALLLESQPAADAATIERLLGEFGLGVALDGLSCIVTLAELPEGIERLPADSTILRLPAAFCCDRANDAALETMREKGFRLMANGLPPSGLELNPAVSMLAVSCPGVGTSPAAAGWLTRLPGPHMALGSDAPACRGRCHFQWLVGHFPEELKPARGKGGEAPNRLLLLELMAKVANDADSHEIEAIIKRDPQLSYHLLKLVNSVAFALPSKITSFGQAIALLGRRQLQRWLQLLLYARSSAGDLANPLLPQAALRAGVVEALARARGATRDAQDRAFMVGMFSLLDLLFGMPLAEIVKPLNLADDVVAALTERSGPFGDLLAAAEAGENPVGDGLAAPLANAGIAHEDWARCLAEACRWAVQVSREA